ncbi:MAG: type I methionyl aminopeptidase [Ruminococcaceae bacterium]|nr:type I methionyl aminopeptidase [Oscillospiraceae bacterium]
MIQLKNGDQIRIMKEAGRITGEALLVARDHVRPGISTYELDRLVREHIEKSGAKPSFLGYGGFPASACISINDEVIHGIPSKKRFLEEGDIVKIDVGAFYKGFHGDSARTIPVGKVSDKALKLIQVTRDSFYAGLAMLQVGNRLGDLGYAIDELVVQNGFSTVKRYIGHGVGQALHESPDVPNYGTPGRGTRLCVGMTLAIEPMVNIGGEAVRELSDGWTVKTADGSLSAHYENSVALTQDGVINLTGIDPDF